MNAVKGLELVEKLSVGLRNELVMAINDFRQLQNGANIHTMANALSKVQGVLDITNSIKAEITKKAFTEMKNLSTKHSDFFSNVHSALDDGVITKSEYNDIERHVNDYKAQLDLILVTLKSVG
jgi:hypothetical protein